MNPKTKKSLEYKKLIENERLLIGSCEFRIVKVRGHEYLVVGQKYLRLANDTHDDCRVKTLIEVHRYYQNQKPELVAYLRQDESKNFERPAFVSICHPNCRKDRAVFLGGSGVSLVNQILRNMRRYDLAAGIDELLCQELAVLDDFD